MSARRDQLVAAFETNDHDAIKAAGWWDIWDMCHTAWAPRQTATASEMVAFAKVLADHDPADVLAALEACAGEWRPVPGELKGYLNGKRGESAKVDAGRASDPAATPEAITAVAALVRQGAAVCGCGCPTARKWRIDPAGVLRCPACDGLEQGQTFMAEDSGLIEVAA